MLLKYSNFLFYSRFSTCVNPFTYKKNIFIGNLASHLEPVFIKKGRWLYYSLSLFLGANVRAFRLLFGYPTRGQRTWSNASTNKNNNVIYNLKFSKFSKFNKSLVPTKSIFLSEYINLFWQKQWFLEWFSVYKKLQFTPLHVKKKDLVDVQSVVSFNINHNFKYNFNRKKIKHKRKRIFPKNKVSTGVPFFYSSVYKNNLTKL